MRAVVRTDQRRVDDTYVLAVGDVGSTITATVRLKAFGGGTPTNNCTDVTVARRRSDRGGHVGEECADGGGVAGAQNPPYVCCWGSQGQFVTLLVQCGRRLDDLVLRLQRRQRCRPPQDRVGRSRLLANQAFARDDGLEYVETLTLYQPGGSGVPPLKVWFDSTAGSDQFIISTNLTVTEVVAAPPPGRRRVLRLRRDRHRPDAVVRVG